MPIKTKKQLSELTKDRPGLNVNLVNDVTENNILDQTLVNRKIVNLTAFTDPQPERDFVKTSLKKLPLADKLAHNFNAKIVKKKQPVTILVDNDADGFSSSGLLAKYLKKVGVPVKFLITKGKNHGIKSPTVQAKILDKHVQFLLIPDASLSLKDITFLTNHHVGYLIIDHHDLNHQKYDVEHSLHIVNNQWDDIPANREFTGVGMSYLFCHQLDQLNGTRYADDLLYFMSVGQVGDVSDVSDLEIRHYILTGFRQMRESHMLNKMTDTYRMSAHELSFSAIPQINAVCRTGSLEDKRQLLDGLVDSVPDDLVKISYRRKSKVDHKFHKHFKDIDRYQLEAKRLRRIKSRQKRAVKKSMKSLRKGVNELSSMIIAVDHKNSFRKTEAGLIATQLANTYQKPTIVLTGSKKPYHYAGSARGNVKVMDNFREFCLQTQLFDYALGHGNAFGVRIKDENLGKLIDDYKSVKLGNDLSYDVDLAYNDAIPSKESIWDVDDSQKLFGGSVSEPSLAFLGMTVHKADIKYWGKVLTFRSHGLKFIQFNGNALKQKIIDSPGHTVHFDVVGTPSINRFMKWTYPQVVVDDIMLTKPIESQHSESSLDDFVF